MMTATRQDLETNLAWMQSYRRNLRSEANRTVDEKSFDDRMAEVDRLTVKIGKLMDRLGY